MLQINTTRKNKKKEKKHKQRKATFTSFQIVLSSMIERDVDKLEDTVAHSTTHAALTQ